jgi:hypothetical protein
MWYEIFDSVFWITVLSILTGCIGLCIKYCLKSKCDNVKCCYGLVEIHRDIEAETEEEMKQMELGISRNESKLNIDG